MAINRITGPTSLPLTTADYQAQNNETDAIFSGLGTIPWSGTAMTIGATFYIGGTIYRVVTATAITGTPSDYVVITPSGDGATATASFVANLSGVSWNSVHNGYYSGGNLVLIGQIYRRKMVYSAPGTYSWICPPWVNSILFNGVGAGGNGATGIGGATGGAGIF